MELIKFKNSSHITSAFLGPRAPARSSPQPHESSHFVSPCGFCPCSVPLACVSNMAATQKSTGSFNPGPTTTIIYYVSQFKFLKEELIDCTGSQLWVGKLSRMMMGKLCDLLNIIYKTKNSFLESQTAYFVDSERNGLSIYLLGTNQLPGSLLSDGDIEIEDTF